MYLEKTKEEMLSFLEAAKRGDIDRLKDFLVDVDVDVNAQDDEGSTALMWAALKGKAEVVELLLAHPKIDINQKGKYGQTALICASVKGHHEVEKKLLAHPNIKPNEKWQELRRSIFSAAFGAAGVFIFFIFR